MKLTSKQRAAVEKYVVECCMSNMFGDGQETDYILYGFPRFQGIKCMTDNELLNEAGYQGDEFNADDTEALNSFLKDLLP